LSRGYLVQGRTDAGTTLQELIMAYANHRRAGQDAHAAELTEVVAAERKETRAWLFPECVDAIAEFPKIREWVTA
jgi:hypothetical protein